MKALPLGIGTIHFVGIGGIGMSGIAELLHNLGYSVQGSDRGENANTGRLKGLGIPLSVGHDEANLGAAQVVVISSAIKPDNPEVVAARKRLLPVVRRAEMLGELMRLKWSIAVGGTHGKTTTTSLVAAVLDAAGMDPTVVNGGIINAWGSNTRLGGGDWMVAEADDSDGTMVKLPATIAVVTNIDPEHLDHYGSFEALREAFVAFVTNIPFYGFAALCIDHPEVQAMIPKVLDRRVVTYGFSPQAAVRGTNLEPTPDGIRFNAVITDRRTEKSRTVDNLFLPMFGRHNAQNALAAIAIANEMDIADDVLRQGVQGISELITEHGLINLDFADVKTIMQNAGSALMGIGRASGENRAVQAAQQAIESPLLEVSIDGARGVLFSIAGGYDMSMHEINEAAEVITNAVAPDANIIFGATLKPDLEDELVITVIATGFDSAYFQARHNAVEEEETATAQPDPDATAEVKEEDISKLDMDLNDDSHKSAFTDDDENPKNIWNYDDAESDTPAFMRRKKKDEE